MFKKIQDIPNNQLVKLSVSENISYKSYNLMPKIHFWILMYKMNLKSKKRKMHYEFDVSCVFKTWFKKNLYKLYEMKYHVNMTTLKNLKVPYSP